MFHLSQHLNVIGDIDYIIEKTTMLNITQNYPKLPKHFYSLNNDFLL